MDTVKHIKPATLEEAFGLNQPPSTFPTNQKDATENLMNLRSVSVVPSEQRKSSKDIFLEKNGFDEAQIYFPSRMNDPSEIPKKVDVEKPQVEQIEVQPFFMPNSEVAVSSNLIDAEEILEYEPSPFIVANTKEVTLYHLSNECIIPVFSKDNERTISHHEFITSVLEAIRRVFPTQQIAKPEIRISHEIKGRVVSAIHKSAKDLLDEDKTLYYERMAFIIKVPGIVDTINGNKLTLTIGGVRAYNHENLYGKKTLEKFRFFVGFQNQVCMNMCISTDGFLEDLRASTTEELENKTVEVLQNYNAELHLMEMKSLTQEYLTEHQFAQLIGKSRLYQHLPKEEKLKIPVLTFNDSHINVIAKDYYEDANFSRLEDGRINLWDVYNLFTQANKSSYIDTFLDRSLSAFEFTKGIQKAINGDSPHHWFLS